MFPGSSRFGAAAPLYPRAAYGQPSTRERRPRQAAPVDDAVTANPEAPPEAPAEADANVAAAPAQDSSRSFYSRVNAVNPFRRIHPFRFPGQRGEPAQNSTAPTPAQLEEGVVR